MKTNLFMRITQYYAKGLDFKKVIKKISSNNFRIVDLFFKFRINRSEFSKNLPEVLNEFSGYVA
ncbi:CLUMA_CG011499, isoform A [Clunio marinus]|uniref:CLUMA_CG011499, isoform A n=1 Tax=Clunio marinus TaxID=568069 RepID=A0A1J1ID41_9DIPT|nr:CLUMA_CG011499, isoform A [Clunio marinus]